MRPIALFLFVSLALALVPAVTSAAADVRSYYQIGPQGVVQIQEAAGADRSSPESAPRPGDLRTGMEQVWQRHLSDAIFTTTSLGGSFLAAATYLNPPKEIGVYAVDGDGTPDWTYAGTEWYVSSSRDGTVIAGVDCNQAAQTVTVGRWEPGSAVPLWTTTIPSVLRGSFRTLLVSGDGSTIAVLVTMQPSSTARLYLFDPLSSVPIGIYDGPAGFGRNLSIGEDGRYAAFIGLATVYVVDRDAGVIRWSGSMDGSNDPLAISTDGRYLAFGWTSLRTLQWNGTAYTALWTTPGAGYWVGVCAFSADGSSLAAAWYKAYTYNQNRLQLYAMPAAAPLWTYDYLLGGGSYQDVPSDLALTAGAEWIALASWGDEFNTNDELHLFRRDQPSPVASFDTPGSMFDCDLAPDGGVIRLTCCGKAIHANQQGRGGDLYSLRYQIPAGIGESVASETAPALRAISNPYRPGAPIRFETRDALPIRAELFDAIGRHVCTLADQAFAAGVHALRWNGRDDASLPAASGAYFLVLEGRAGRCSGRLTLVR